MWKKFDWFAKLKNAHGYHLNVSFYYPFITWISDTHKRGMIKATHQVTNKSPGLASTCLDFHPVQSSSPWHQTLLACCCHCVLGDELLLHNLIAFYLSATCLKLADSDSLKSSPSRPWHPWLRHESMLFSSVYPIEEWFVSLFYIPLQVDCNLIAQALKVEEIEWFNKQ